MNRWYATSKPQHMLPAVAACAFGTTLRVSAEQISNDPALREAP